MNIKSKTFQIERPWGNFRQFTKNESSTVKIITLNPNECLSLQSHSSRSEFWYIISGSGIVEIREVKKEAHEGDEYEVPVDTKHRISASAEGIKVLEISIGDFDEGDIIHYEDKYGRT